MISQIPAKYYQTKDRIIGYYLAYLYTEDLKPFELIFLPLWLP